MPNVHPPLSSYCPGDHAVITLPGHPRNGEVVEVVRYHQAYEELTVQSLNESIRESFSSATSLTPVVNTLKRPVSPIFYSLQT